VRFSKFILAFAAASINLDAAVVDYSATFSTVVDNFFPGAGGTGSHWTYLLLNGSTPELTGTLNAGQQLRITYSAPAGQQINIFSKPASADSLLVAFDIWSESPQSSPFVPTSGTSYSFTGLTGTPPIAGIFEFREAADEKFRASLHLSSGDFSFQSLQMIFDIPAGYDRTFTNHIPSDVVLVVIANWSSDAFDPGPLASITLATNSVPEPSTAILVAAALGVLVRFGYQRRSPVGGGPRASARTT
jgi:hypothetical protein